MEGSHDSWDMGIHQSPPVNSWETPMNYVSSVVVNVLDQKLGEMIFLSICKKIKIKIAKINF